MSTGGFKRLVDQFLSSVIHKQVYLGDAEMEATVISVDDPMNSFKKNSLTLMLKILEFFMYLGFHEMIEGEGDSVTCDYGESEFVTRIKQLTKPSMIQGS